jgi:hypothetical protein
MHYYLLCITYRILYLRRKNNLFLSRATPVLGFLPQELLGTSMYEYYHHDDIPHLAESHKAALQTPERVATQVIEIIIIVHS